MPEVPIQLVQQAIAGDRAAFRGLVHALTPVIHARVARVLMRYRGGSSWDARQEVRDFVQQVFVVLFEDDNRVLRQWDPERGRSFSSFVSLVAERETISILRSRSQNPWTDEVVETDLERGDDGESGPESVVASREEIGVILAAVRARLGERGLSLFRLLVVEERPPEEVGEVMGMTRDAVYAWEGRFRRMVREIARGSASDPEVGARKAGGGAP